MKHQYQISRSPILSALFWSPSLSFTHNCTPNCPLWGKQQHQYKILYTLEYHHLKKQTIILTCTVYSLRWFWRSTGTCYGLRSLSPPHCSLSPLSGSALWPQPEVPLCQSMLDLSQHLSICLKLKMKCCRHNLITCSQSHDIYCLLREQNEGWSLVNYRY